MTRRVFVRLGFRDLDDAHERAAAHGQVVRLTVHQAPDHVNLYGAVEVVPHPPAPADDELELECG